MIERLQTFHDCGFIHCDLKPDNMLIGNSPGTSGLIHLIDFGCTHTYLDSENAGHVEE
jgi:casein kinase I family protein HRR25